LNSSKFMALGISGQFSHALAEVNFESPTEIQDRAIPVVLRGQDVLGIAQTGTGKTVAFGLPLLQLLDLENTPAQSKHPRAVVLAPTRELASQIYKELSFFAQPTSLRLTCIFGGVGQHPQVKALSRGVDILIATPGRLLDLAQQGAVKLGHVSHLVLDEADRLLDLGFARDVKRIVDQTPKKRHSLLFSATMPSNVEKFASAILHNPERVDISPRQITVEKIEQRIAFVRTAEKPSALRHLLCTPEVKKAIVFTRTKHGANRVAQRLEKSGIGAEAIHGNKSQSARTKALDSFSKDRSWVLVATDIAARGIDVDGVTHVINFDVPHDPESYVHRIGRTGRAGAEGCAWSFVDPSERKRLHAVEKLIGFSPRVVDLEFTVDPAVADQKPTSSNTSSRGDARGTGRSTGRGNGRGDGPRDSNANGRVEGQGDSSRARRRNRRRKSRAKAA
jgi:ATP-dependent RNA helicase RhlE